ncbi:hypothetical protein O6486_23835, partial [Salmonella enterica subsp. enterica]
SYFCCIRTAVDVLSYSFLGHLQARLPVGNDAVVLFVYGVLCQGMSCFRSGAFQPLISNVC